MKKLVGLGGTVVGVLVIAMFGMDVWAQKTFNGDKPLQTLCGNGVIDPIETCESCPEDVGPCDTGDDTGGDTDDNTEGGSSMDRAERLGQITSTSGRIKDAVDALRKGDKNGDNPHQLTEGDWNALLELLDLLQKSDVNISDLLDDNGTNTNVTPVDSDTVDITDLVPEGAIMAFALTECPDGWTRFDEAEGRFLMGVNSTSSDLLQTTYGGNVGTLGVKNKVMLKVENLPEHHHYMFGPEHTNTSNEFKLKSTDKRFVTLHTEVGGHEEYHMAAINDQRYSSGGYKSSYENKVRAGLTSSILVDDRGNDVTTWESFDITNANVKVLFCKKVEKKGKCGSEKNTCKAGALGTSTESDFAYKWTCVGSEGESRQCKKCKNGYSLRDGMCVRDGQCGNVKNKCDVGTKVSYDGLGADAWACQGQSGETDPQTQICWMCNEGAVYKGGQNGQVTPAVCMPVTPGDTTAYIQCGVFTYYYGDKIPGCVQRY